MKRFFVIPGVCMLITLVLPLSSQQGATAPRGIYGQWNPKTGIFTPIRQAPVNNADDAEPPPVTVYTGKIVVNFTITITSAIPTTTAIACNVNAVVVDSTGELTDSLATSATRSGSTATCSVTIPYSWSISSTSDLVSIAYDVSAPPQPNVASSPFPRRYSAHPVATITIPANGATTTYAIADTI